MLAKSDSQTTCIVDSSWGPQPSRPFVFTEKHSGWDLFQEHYQAIILTLEEHCETHLNGNWLLTQCLWGESLETSSPTILLLFESKKESWSCPITEWHGQSLKLLEIQDEIKYHASFPKYMKEVNSSCVIGNSDFFGTLGGYLENEDGEVAALTCGHVCGIRLGEEFTSSIIQQPPESSLNKFRQDYPSYVILYQFPKDSEMAFGTVMNGEIYVQSHHYDWALIKININRLGINSFPLDPFGNNFGGSVSVQPIELADNIWKSGYATNIMLANTLPVKSTDK